MKNHSRCCGLAWAAGFFEGEGCITTASKGKYARLSISGVDKEPLDEFASIVGAGKVYGPYGPYQSAGQRSPIYQWAVQGGTAWRVLNKIFPMLSAKRVAQASEVFGKEQVETALAPPPTRR